MLLIFIKSNRQAGILFAVQKNTRAFFKHALERVRMAAMAGPGLLAAWKDWKKAGRI